MKRTLFSFCVACCFAATLPSLPLLASDITFQAANLTIVWSEADRAFNIQGTLNDGTTKDIVTRSKPKATYINSAGADRGYFTTDRYSDISYRTEPLADEFGNGTAHIFTFSAPDKAAEDKVLMEQVFYAYDQLPCVLTRLLLISQGDAISSHHLEPVCCESATWQFLSTKQADNRMLKVPFDNDGFGRYHTYHLTRSMTSYEVSCLFDGAARYGAVYGSVDHGHWKSGICVEASRGTSIKKLQLICGMADGETRDHLSDYDKQSHGNLTGDTIQSPRFLLGLFDDWRTGMEQFAEACATIHPARRYWQHGTPFGWQSWGVMAEKNSYEADLEICQYYAEELQPAGFCSEDGSVVFSLDASSNISDTQRKQLTRKGRSTNQLIGSYCTPFALWWDEPSIYNINATWTEKGKQVSKPFAETLIKINGKPVKYDGAYCRDPTHPATRQDIQNYVRARVTEGVKWIKADFLNCGIIQSDSYYQEGITTAVEAYNEGMSYLSELCERYGIFLDLSIAPLFPHGYANGRRIACDTWARIDQTEYAMNAISGGWWTDRLYQFNDPDHLVLVGNGDQGGTTLGENRARITSGAVTGMMLVADNFSITDTSGRGNNTLSRQRAAKVLTNAGINAIARLGRSFRPLYGHKEYDLNSDHAQDLFVHETDSCIYLAAFNFTGSRATFDIPLSDLGNFTADDFSEILELWMGEALSPSPSSLKFSVPAKDARVIRLLKSHPKDRVATAPPLSASIIRTEYFDLVGRRATPDAHSALLLQRATYSDGTIHTRKMLR